MKRAIAFFGVLYLFIFISCSDGNNPTNFDLQNASELNAQTQSLKFIGDTYQANLSGDGPAVGRAVFNFLDGDTKLYYRLHVFSIKGVTAAHVHHAHGGASTGHAVLTLFDGQASQFRGKLAEGILTSDDITCTCQHQDHHTLTHLKKHFNDGETYVNVHTMKNPAGEIRGSIDLK